MNILPMTARFILIGETAAKQSEAFFNFFEKGKTRPLGKN
jgi:hypothetical protein